MLTNETFIQEHREADVRKIALMTPPEGVDLKWCLQQIEGWQLARRKLPHWAKTEGLWYAPRLSMEQCSSEATAQYKRKVVERLIPQEERTQMTDLTGGLGVDFSFLAPLFLHCTYVEIQPHLMELAQHNLPLLGLPHAQIASPENWKDPDPHHSLFFIDPARRDEKGRKIVAIEDCTPNVLDLQDKLLNYGGWLMVKLSPMLDIHHALRQLHGVSEVHVISVQGECKELLFVMRANATDPLIHCMNLNTDDVPFVCSPDSHGSLSLTEELEGTFLFEPNASILKAGVQNVLCEHFDLQKLHPMSHLFTADKPIPRFPGRRFRITGWSDFGKRNLRQLIGDLRQANLTTRNFPTPVAALRHQLRLSEGGSIYFFATTLANGQHILIRCEKVSAP